MAELSNAETALLGLLSEKAMHAYQIEKEVVFRDMRFWTELSMSSIYKVLRVLETKKLVKRKDEITSEKRLKKLYTLTPLGLKTLKEKVETLLTTPQHMRWAVDLGIYNCDLIPPKALEKALRNYKNELTKKITCYNNLIDFLGTEGCPVHRFGIATRPIYLLEGEVKWIDYYLNDLKSSKKIKQ